jgi:16S rRNA processing protein RimM
VRSDIKRIVQEPIPFRSPLRMRSKRLVVIGEAVKPFGIRGELKVHPFTESFEAFERSSTLVLGNVPYRVQSFRKHKGAALISFEGIDTPEKARELVGSLVQTAPENLPPKEDDEYYWFELIGMKVRTVDGRDLGTVADLMRTGAHDVLQVEGDYGEVLLPMIEQVVLEVDTEKGEVLVDPLEGLIPDV